DICQSSFVTATVTIFPVPSISLGNDTVVSASITLDAGGGFASYLWSNSETTQTILVGNTGTYSVTVTDANGCVASDTINVLMTVGIIEMKGSDPMLLYPNPAHDVITVQFNS